MELPPIIDWLETLYTSLGGGFTALLFCVGFLFVPYFIFKDIWVFLCIPKREYEIVGYRYIRSNLWRKAFCPLVRYKKDAVYIDHPLKSQIFRPEGFIFKARVVHNKIYINTIFASLGLVCIFCSIILGLYEAEIEDSTPITLFLIAAIVVYIFAPLHKACQTKAIFGKSKEDETHSEFRDLDASSVKSLYDKEVVTYQEVMLVQHWEEKQSWLNSKIWTNLFLIAAAAFCFIMVYNFLKFFNYI